MFFTGLGGGSRPLGGHQQAGLSKFSTQAASLMHLISSAASHDSDEGFSLIAPLEHRRCRAGLQVHPQQFLLHHLLLNFRQRTSEAWQNVRSGDDRISTLLAESNLNLRKLLRASL